MASVQYVCLVCRMLHWVVSFTAVWRWTEWQFSAPGASEDGWACRAAAPQPKRCSHTHKKNDASTHWMRNWPREDRWCYLERRVFSSSRARTSRKSFFKVMGSLSYVNFCSSSCSFFRCWRNCWRVSATVVNLQETRTFWSEPTLVHFFTLCCKLNFELHICCHASEIGGGAHSPTHFWIFSKRDQPPNTEIQNENTRTMEQILTRLHQLSSWFYWPIGWFLWGFLHINTSQHNTKIMTFKHFSHPICRPAKIGKTNQPFFANFSLCWKVKQILKDKVNWNSQMFRL